MGSLTPDQIYRVCLDAGFSPDQAVTWTAIALAESGGNPGAHNPRGEDSQGLWQINVDPQVRPNRWGDLSDPAVNARAAFEISGGGTDMRPWTVTHASNQGTDHDYRNFMDEAQAAAGGVHTGDFTGVEGYHDPSPSGPAGGAVAAADVEPVPGSVLTAEHTDSDADGAFDAFEMSSGTDPHTPDSDHDGLTDGFELLRGTGADLVDSDDDGLSDRHELRTGSDPLAGDSDQDGVFDAVELAAGRDPLHGVAATALVHDGPAGAVLDSDGDGMSDVWEASLGTDAHLADSDHDGLTDAVELAGRTDSLDPDTDDDGIVDDADPETEPFLQTAWTATATTAVATATGADPVMLAPAPDATPDSRTQLFLDHALAQTGDSYVFGSEAAATTADPGTFDCSELTQWAAGQVGIDLPDGSWLQYLELEKQGAVVPVDQALHTPGALLFSFPSEPTAGGGRPAGAHVAISLGDGRTIEARSTRLGVGSWDAGDRFTYAAVLPELPVTDVAVADGTDPSAVALLAPVGPTADDGDADGVIDSFEMSAGTDPHVADSDGDGLTDGFELRSGLDGTLLDADDDGLSDAYETELGSSAVSLDTDGDGIVDGMEVALGHDARYGIAPETVEALTGHSDALLDADGDGLSDAWELSMGTDATSTDSDHDYLGDALELARHTDPHDPDTDDDGELDTWERLDDPEP